jgi:DNA-binding IclR family transcriptional regulator
MSGRIALCIENGHLKTPSVPALERGLAILELVAMSRNGLTFSQIARQLEFPKSSIHCLLVTFEREGYLHRHEPTGRYVCGEKLIKIANSAMSGILFREKALPVLRSLAERTSLTAHMAILDGGVATLIAKADMAGTQKVATWVGKRIDIHCTSLGKCLTAYLAETDLDSLVREHGLLRHNENTIASVSGLKRELSKTRTLGYAIDDEEEEIGIRCLGVPVFGANHDVIAAISVSGTVSHMQPEQCGALINELRRCASEIAARLDTTRDGDGADSPVKSFSETELLSPRSAVDPPPAPEGTFGAPITH